MTGLLTELGYVGLEVSDLGRWERFAAEVLGLGVRTGTRPDTRLLRMDANQYRFILSEGPADDAAFLGWQCADVANLEEYGRRLDGLGIAWAWASEDELALRSVERMLHFKDPAGIRHEAYAGPRLECDRFSSPLVSSDFVTGEGGVGHTVFGVANPGLEIEFAQKVLGARISDYIRLPLAPGVSFDVCFLHLNARHHSFAIAPARPGSSQRLHHFMIEVNALDDVGFARDRCLAMGQPVQMDIGQHPNDRMISFYGETPSGFLVEFGYGGIQVGADWQLRSYGKLSEWGHRPSAEVKSAPATKSVEGAAARSSVSATGLWDIIIKTPLGERKASLDLKVEGGTLTGSLKDDGGSHELTAGVVNGDQLTWNAKVSKPVPMNLSFSAQYDADAIKGGAKSPFGTAPFSGHRA